MPSILIAAVDAIGGYFIAAVLNQNGYRAVLDAGINRSPEQLLHLLRLGGGRDIPVLRCASQHSVPDAAADGIGFMPGFI